MIKQPSAGLIFARSKIFLEKDYDNYDGYKDSMIVDMGEFDFRIRGVGDLMGKKTEWSIPISAAETAAYFDAELNNHGYASEQIEIDVAEYAELRGYSIEKTNRVLDKDIEILKKIEYREGRGQFAPFYDSVERIRRRQSVKIYFSAAFYDYLNRNRRFMYLPKSVYRINNQTRPHAYFFGQKIAAHKAMNNKKSNGDILRVSTIMESSPKMKRTLQLIYDNMENHITRAAYEPFIKNMNALDGAFSWTLTERNGTEVTAEAAMKLPIHKFKELRARIAWKDYPEKDSQK